MSRFRSDIRWGLGWSTWVAGFFSIYVLAVSLVRGSAEVGAGHFPVWQVLVGYWAAALLCGALLGVVRPITSTRGGAFLTGTSVGFLAYGTLGVLLYGFVGWVGWTSLAASLVTGGLGVVFRDGIRFAAGVTWSRAAVYLAVLVAAALLLYMDVKFHIINK